MSDNTIVEVTFDKERIKAMETPEKLNTLIDIAFANHQELRRQGRVLYGENGAEGVCDIVRTTRNAVKWLWGIFCMVAAGFFTILMLHVMK